MFNVTKTRKPYQYDIKAKNNTRKLRTQDRSIKNKKYPKKYLGGLHSMDLEKNGNIDAHAITRCIYRICKKYQVSIPGTTENLRRSSAGPYDGPDDGPDDDSYDSDDSDDSDDPNDSLFFDDWVKIKKGEKEVESLTQGQKIDLYEYEQIYNTQRSVYFILLPIITYYIVFFDKYYSIYIDPEKFTYEFYDMLSPSIFHKPAEILEDYKLSLINDPVFENMKNYLVEKKIINSYGNNLELLNKQLRDFNDLTENLRNKIANNKKINFKLYDLDEYLRNKTNIYGYIHVKGDQLNRILGKTNNGEEGHTVAITDITEEKTPDITEEKTPSLIKITYKDTEGIDFGMEGHKKVVINKDDIENFSDKKKEVIAFMEENNHKIDNSITDAIILKRHEKKIKQEEFKHELKFIDEYETNYNIVMTYSKNLKTYNQLERQLEQENKKLEQKQTKKRYSNQRQRRIKKEKKEQERIEQAIKISDEEKRRKEEERKRDSIARGKERDKRIKEKAEKIKKRKMEIQEAKMAEEAKKAEAVKMAAEAKKAEEREARSKRIEETRARTKARDAQTRQRNKKAQEQNKKFLAKIQTE